MAARHRTNTGPTQDQHRTKKDFTARAVIVVACLAAALARRGGIEIGWLRHAAIGLPLGLGSAALLVACQAWV